MKQNYFITKLTNLFGTNIFLSICLLLKYLENSDLDVIAL